MSGLPPGSQPPGLDQILGGGNYGAILQALLQIAGALSHLGTAIAPPSGNAGGDLAGSYPNPTVVATHLTAPLPHGQGGTGNTTGQPAGTAGGDLGGTYPNPIVTQVHLLAPLPPSQGGTGGSGGVTPPSGPAGGDLGGTYPNPNVTGIAANPVAVTSWTPALEFGASGVGIVYTTRSGSYLRLGHLVVASFSIALSSKGAAAGVATIAGLPFACGTLPGVAVIASHAAMATSNVFEIEVGAGTFVITLGAGNAVASTALTNTDFTNTTSLSGTATYIAA